MNTEKMHPTVGNTDWFTHDRFGMFIHWGLYALPARHEWIKTYERIPEEKYQKYFEYFNPDLYDPVEWAQMAKDAGMKYVVITTKHHEGFCLFDSKYTDYKVTNTPIGRDLLAEFVEAFRDAGLKIGFYYSLLDWHHPEFPIDPLHPRRDDKEFIQKAKNRDMKKYAEYMRNQVEELLTQYGKIDIMWFDFSYPDMEKEGLVGKGKVDWEAEELIELTRKLQPNILINNRTEIDQDIWTPEQVRIQEWPKHEESGKRVVWEVCQTFSGSWGYHRDEQTWKTPEMLIQMLANTVSYGGNLLLNVGPTARGKFDDRATYALEAIGEWMKYNARSIYGCTASKFTAPQDCRYTQNGNRLYLHVFAWPFKNIFLDGLKGKVDYIQFLHDGSEIIYREDEEKDQIILDMPVIKPNVTVPVIEIFLKE